MNSESFTDTTTITNEVVKKKRGRKKKSELEANPKPVENTEPTIPKKRGRKPKGGKLIIKPIESNDDNSHLSNIILHLKCSLQDIDNQNNNSINNPLVYTPTIPPNIMTYEQPEQNFFNYNNENVNKGFAYEVKSEPNTTNNLCNKCKDSIHNENKTVHDEDDGISMKDINSKLKELKIQLYKDSNPDKKSACFWCTYEYDNPTCYIPKYELEGNIIGYGSFCRPECAVAYLMKENVDDSAKFERYQLLNKIYGKVYNFNKNIKPAPNPYYLLDKFFGNLSIQEYRKLMKSEHMLLILEKPLTRILPELHEDMDENSDKYSSKQKSSGYKVKRQSEKEKGPTKNEIMKEKFGF